ncbi:hypothetical protein QN277_010702 [Acacia crassicarpa]|uniref:Plant bHLH transcription factor ACT-like domain-containing protein n=1 Tax=Acacia crassicarpa TaxID=499986 RepID=A0AAE1JHR6_9FABA|nr:hypothetical protein QN277_010702 [Acacia crassicarpa]
MSSSTRDQRKKKHSQKKSSSNHQQDDEAESSTSFHDDSPSVSVETLEKGFQVNVFSEKNCPAMLVSVLQAFEQLGLDVLDARVSCEDTFQLEALGGSQSEEKEIDAQTVKQTVLQAINNVMD